MKKIRRILFVLISLLLLLSLVGCSEEETVYTIDYDSQSATTPADPTNMIVADGETVVALPTAPVKTGFAFGGWFTEVDGGGSEFTTSTVVTDNLTVYAMWGYTVTYDGNGITGGVVPTSNVYIDGQVVTVVGNTGSMVKTNSDGISLLLEGWNTQADGNGTDYALASGTFSMGSAPVTLYAKWSDSVLRGIGPAGGLVFYDKGSYSDGWRYLEAAPSDQSSRLQWYNWSDMITGATAKAIGTGQANTSTIISAQGAGSYAATICDDLTIASYSDWFLPSQDELNRMYINLHKGIDENSVSYAPVGGFGSFPSYYWSSSEFNDANSESLDFSDGMQSLSSKNSPNRVRAVRSF